MASLVECGKGLGVDLGGTKTVTVLGDGELVRNELGGHETASLVSFKPRERLVGEVAVNQASASPRTTVISPHLMVGVDYSAWSAGPLVNHLAFSHSEADGPLGGVKVSVEREGGEQTFTGTELLAMLIAKLRSCAMKRVGETGDLRLGCFSCSPAASLTHRRAVLDAAKIAGFQEAKVFTAPECLCAAYAQKHPVLPGADPEPILMVDMGHLQTSISVSRFSYISRGEDDMMVDGEDRKEANGAGKGKGKEKGTCTWEVVLWRCSPDLGAFNFDQEMFMHFKQMLKTSRGVEIQPGTKQGLRLLAACRRLRELLSTIPVASTTVENLVDGQDVPLSATRAELAALCKAPLDRFRAALGECLKESGLDTPSIKVAELLGGGSRMPLIQDLVMEMGLQVGSKLDNASLAFGAVLLGERGASLEATAEAMGAEGLSPEAVSVAASEEQGRQALDAEMQALAERRNEIESLVYDMRGGPGRPHGELLDREKLNAYLDEVEDWLYSEEAKAANLQQMEGKHLEVTARLKTDVAKEYLEAVESEKKQVEKRLEEEAAKAAEERKNNPEADDDHDFRKLPKPERMRMVIKNKDEGNELFTGKNYRMAGARYSKALTHAAKFFDLSPEDQEEVRAVQLSLYLNLAQCYLKMENWDQAINNCGHALNISPDSAKALYRRAYAFSAKKDWDRAKADLLKAFESSPEDKAVATLMKKVDAAIKKQNEKERNMWGKAFA